MLHIAAQQAAGLRGHPQAARLLNVGAGTIGHHIVRVGTNQDNRIVGNERLGGRLLRVCPVVVVHFAVGVQIKAWVSQVPQVLHAVGQVTGIDLSHVHTAVVHHLLDIGIGKEFLLGLLAQNCHIHIGKAAGQHLVSPVAQVAQDVSLGAAPLVFTAQSYLVGETEVNDLIHALAHNGDGACHDCLNGHPLLPAGGGIIQGGVLLHQLLSRPLGGGHTAVQILSRQTGKYYEREMQAFLAAHPAANIWQGAFIDRMDYAYAAADLVLSRSGAGTVSELCLVAKPVLFVPSPNVAEDHQTKNAKALEAKGAAVVVPDAEARTAAMRRAMELLSDKEALRTMSENLEKLARPDAAERIVDEIEKVMK